MNKQFFKSPIYVIGAPRSGTTLVAKILGRHSRIFMPGETHFFEDIYSRSSELGTTFDFAARKRIMDRLFTLYGRYNEPLDQKRVEYLLSDSEKRKTLMAGWQNYRDVLVSFMELQMNHEKKQRWGNNVPRDIFNHDDILSFFPNAKIIICVRDPRDFMLSYKGKWRITSQENVKRMKLLYHPILTSLLWKSSINLIPVLKRKVPPSNLMILHYENLVSQAHKKVEEMCSFIGEQFEIQMLDIDSANSSYQVETKGIFSTSVGRWRQSLPADEASISQLFLKKELSQLGYPSEKLSTNHLKIFKHFATFPIRLLVALNSNRGNKGPMLIYLARRIDTLRLKYQKTQVLQ